MKTVALGLVTAFLFVAFLELAYPAETRGLELWLWRSVTGAGLAIWSSPLAVLVLSITLVAAAHRFLTAKRFPSRR